ncbi:MAG: hypothetical protein K2G49_11475 [Muribaculum sp.]|nr:hypothetical protein [Muribaculum sp.]
MKKIITLLFTLMLFGNKLVAVTDLEFYTFAPDSYIEKCTDIPVVRNINGGTVFNVTYEGPWSKEMMGAFEYACKIWAENLPTIPPCKS